jgi:hypothetical protein
MMKFFVANSSNMKRERFPVQDQPLEMTSTAWRGMNINDLHSSCLIPFYDFDYLSASFLAIQYIEPHHETPFFIPATCKRTETFYSTGKAYPRPSRASSSSSSGSSTPSCSTVATI